jgi:NAD(P)-dependent dehydrogenase (short-subunit alcohol dehydrogenase family)
MPDLSGKVAIVTGAASGIGKTTAQTLARHGASVVVAGHSMDGAEAVASEIRAQGGAAVAVGVEIADEQQVKAMVEAAVTNFGGLDCLHNNAAATRMHRDTDVVSIDTEVWVDTLAVNLTGPFFGCKYAIPEMLKRGGGAIVNTSSAAGLQAERIRVSYGVSKAALHGLTRHVANAFGKQNIRCNAIALGMIMTEAAERNVPAPMIAALEENNALARLGRTEDVAEVVAFLFSDQASFITGEVISVDGGFTSHLPSLVD